MDMVSLSNGCYLILRNLRNYDIIRLTLWCYHRNDGIKRRHFFIICKFLYGVRQIHCYFSFRILIINREGEKEIYEQQT